MTGLPRHFGIHQRFHADTDTDLELMTCLQTGCTDCFALLFRRYGRMAFSVSYRILRERCEAEDIVQEVFLTVLLQRTSYDAARGTVATWIAQLAHFKALQRRRRMFTRASIQVENFCKFEHFMKRGRTETILERAAVVEEALAMLTPGQRRTIEMVHFDGYTLAETAEILQQSLANTRNHYYRGLKMLRKLLHRMPDSVSPDHSDNLYPAMPHPARS